MQVESAVLAEEIVKIIPQLMKRYSHNYHNERAGNQIVRYISHEAFKEQAKQSRGDP